MEHAQRPQREICYAAIRQAAEGRAMTDMYFPQFGIHVEVDEGHHKAQIEADKLREADIVDATGHQIFRIDVTKYREHSRIL